MLTSEKKQARIERAERHAMLDLLRAGNYVEDGYYRDPESNERYKGCSVGCDMLDIIGYDGYLDTTFDRYHKIVADHDGTPVWLEELRDEVFEGLPENKRSWWHVELAKSLPVNEEFGPYYQRLCNALHALRAFYMDHPVIKRESVWAPEDADLLTDAITSDGFDEKSSDDECVAIMEQRWLTIAETVIRIMGERTAVLEETAPEESRPLEVV